jgi:hypothetical protein
MTIMTKNTIMCLGVAAVALFITPSTKAQVSIFNENFDPLSAAGAVSVNGDFFGDTTSFSGAVVSGVGVGGTAAIQEVLNAASGSAGYSGANVEYGNGSLSGNTSSSLSDYTLSFEAMANAGSLRLNLQSWQLNGYANYTGQISTAPDNPGYGNDLTLNPTYTHYSLNLGNTSVFQSSIGGFQIQGGTLMITFQLDGGGATPYTDALDIDNLELTMVPEPSTLALLAVGSVGIFGCRRISRRV